MTMPETWVLEPDVFSEVDGWSTQDKLANYARFMGHKVVAWNDSFWEEGVPTIKGPSWM